METFEINIDLPFIQKGTKFTFIQKSGDIFRDNEVEPITLALGAYLWLLKKERVYSDAELIANNQNPEDNPHKFFKKIE